MFIGPMPTELVLTAALLAVVFTAIFAYQKWDDKKRWRTICERSENNLDDDLD
jgi:hypothetical protein